MNEARVGGTGAGSGGLERRRAVAFLPTGATLANFICGCLAILCALMSAREENNSAATLAAVNGFVAETPGERNAPTAVREQRESVTRSRTDEPAPLRTESQRFRPWRRGAVREVFEEMLPTYISVGAYLLLLGMLFDAVDGRLARWMRRTSNFGAQLDSLADVVSFGVAPAILVLAMLLRPDEAGILAARWQWQIGLAAALLYAACAAARLARFNAEHSSGAGAHEAFRGLPTPGAAVVMVALLLLYEDLVARDVLAAGGPWRTAALWTIVIVPSILGAFMVSRWRFPHVINMYVGKRGPAGHLLWLLAALAAVALLHLPGTLLLGSLLYLASSRPPRRTAQPVNRPPSPTMTGNGALSERSLKG